LAFRREAGGESFLNGETLDLEELRLTGPVGELTGHGRWSFDGPLDFRFRGGRLSLAELVGPDRAQRLGIGGTLNFDGRVDGDDTTPIVTLALTSPRITFAERSLGEMLLNGKVTGREMQVWGKPFTDAYASMKMSLRGLVPYDATVTLKLPEIRPLLSAGAISQGVSGVLEGVLHAKGEAREPAATTRADATLTRLTLSRGDFTAENDGDLVLHYADKRLDVASFALRGPNTRLGVSGWVDPERLDVKLEGGLDMRLFESFLPVLERTGGQLQLDANAHGRLDEPSLVGSAKLRDVRLALKDRAVAARSLVGEVEFSERGIVLQELRGILNDGRVSVRGEVKMDRFVPKTVKVDAQLDEVAFRPTEDLPLTASGQLTLEGKPDALTLTGGLDVLKLRYERPLELETLLRSAGAARATIASESAKTGKDWVRFGVTVRLGDVRVENNLARAHLLGELKLVGTNARPGLPGTVETGPGSQAFFRGNRFTVTQGVIEFKDEKSIDPTFDLRAETQVREYLVRLHAYGRPADPKLALTSEPELVEGDVISLLTLGVISSDRNSTASASAGLATEALLNVSGLDREVQRFLPKNAVLRDLSFHVATTYNEASGLVEPAAQLESKFLTEQLKLGMTRPVSGRGTRAQAEYRFTNGLSAQAQWDNDQRDTSSSSSIGNLGLDLKLRWEVE
ncbi:MAG TPA: translocation/assembly module TamB domain-containing protein, partial [Myxococcaceae bacterium]|nr:translocation/assembly module TamB domain-containing protein [Myxococcaceae bacterium]